MSVMRSNSFLLVGFLAKIKILITTGGIREIPTYRVAIVRPKAIEDKIKYIHLFVEIQKYRNNNANNENMMNGDSDQA